MSKLDASPAELNMPLNVKPGIMILKVILAQKPNILGHP